MVLHIFYFFILFYLFHLRHLLIHIPQPLRLNPSSFSRLCCLFKTSTSHLTSPTCGKPSTHLWHPSVQAPACIAVFILVSTLYAPLLDLATVPFCIRRPFALSLPNLDVALLKLTYTGTRHNAKNPNRKPRRATVHSLRRSLRCTYATSELPLDRFLLVLFAALQYFVPQTYVPNKLRQAGTCPKCL